MTRRSRLMFGLLALLIVGSPAAQTTYPDKPIRLVVGFPRGGQTDFVARLLGQKLSEALGKPLVVENIVHAAGNIATERVATAAPDGYTLGLMVNPELVINPSLYQLAVDPVNDFALVSQVAASPHLLVVHNAVPAKNVKELVALAKAQPGALTFASGGTGTMNHMAAVFFNSVAGLDIRHIPYRGGGPAILGVTGGRVTMIFSPTGAVLPFVRNGKLRALAVTSLQRSSAAPELPTIVESGYPGFEVTTWFGLLAPARTPPPIVGKLQLETAKALAYADVRAKLADLGLEGIGNSPDEFAAVIKSEIRTWAKVIKESGIKPD